LTALLLGVPLTAMDANPAADPVGVWKTVDDNSHKPRGLIRLFERDGEIYGRIEASFDPKEAHELCSKCAGDLKDKPVIGMVVLRHMKKHGSEYSGGDIVDPDSGWIYRCRFTLEDGGKKMLIRGYLGFSLFGRSQTWYREPAEADTEANTAVSAVSHSDSQQ
jgi:uncharacterized protein (DUF2147 family)